MNTEELDTETRALRIVLKTVFAVAVLAYMEGAGVWQAVIVTSGLLLANFLVEVWRIYRDAR